MVGESKKYCLLTDEAHNQLLYAIQRRLGEEAENHSEIERETGLNRASVAKIIDRKAVNHSTLQKMMEKFDLELTENSYTKQAPPKSPGVAQDRSKAFLPNPFEEAVFWGREELLRQIFGQLRKRGSQALIGPAGCGKSKILEAIVREGEECLGCPIFQFDMHLVRDERSFFDRLCGEFGLEASDSLSRVPSQIERELKRRKQPQILCLDEIHVLTNEAFFPEATRNWLKGMADAEYPLQLVVASQKELNVLFPESPLRSSPLADFFRSQTVRLDYWSLGQVTKFVGDRLQGTGITFEANHLGEIWDKSRGTPKEVRELARRVYETIVAGKI